MTSVFHVGGRIILIAVLLLAFWCTDASAQLRIEGTVRWADGTPAASLTVAIPELKLTTTTDHEGRYAFRSEARHPCQGGRLCRRRPGPSSMIR